MPSIYIKRFVSLSVSLSVRLSVTFCLSLRDKQFVCPRGQTFLTHSRGGGQTFLTHRREGGDKHFSHTVGWPNIFTLRGGAQTFLHQGGGDKHLFVGGSGAYDDVDEEMVEFLVAHRAMKF